MATNSENLERYKATFSKRDTKGFIYISDDLPIAEHIRILCGPPYLTEDSVKKDEKAQLDVALASKSKNPYERARAKILSDMTKSDRAAVEKAEISGVETNFYHAFLRNVAKLGDQFSEEKS